LGFCYAGVAFSLLFRLELRLDLEIVRLVARRLVRLIVVAVNSGLGVTSCRDYH